MRVKGLLSFYFLCISIAGSKREGDKGGRTPSPMVVFVYLSVVLTTGKYNRMKF